ncbi:MAG: hypothetical protein KF749_08400 [Bacteroidetes bacterium]|nr:hypothetical protein [Bacteroidota bacterium]MCW5895975.1 hypothetical protein [Bacteroidota bacterium]
MKPTSEVDTIRQALSPAAPPQHVPGLSYGKQQQLQRVQELTHANRPPRQYSSIEFLLKNDGFVTLQLFDSAGEEIARIFNEAPFKAGVHYVGLAENELKFPRLYRLSVRSEGTIFEDVRRIGTR